MPTQRVVPAATVISELVGIPPHLSLPTFRCPALDLSHDQHPESLLGFIRNFTGS
jgi:hypothetical protein